MAVNFDPVRRWLLNEGKGNEAVASALEAAFTAAMAGAGSTGGASDLTALQAALAAAVAAAAAAQAAAEAAQETADDAPLNLPTYHLDPAAVLAIVEEAGASGNPITIGDITFESGEGAPTRTDRAFGSYYGRTDVSQLWRYVEVPVLPGSGVNIVGTDLKASGSTYIATLSGYATDQVLRFSKPLAADSGGLLSWDAYSAFPLDANNGGKTWTNAFSIYGNNGGSDVLLFGTTLDIALYATSADAFAAVATEVPVRVTGYATYKIVGPIDPNPADNRGGLSLLYEELVGRWVLMSDLTSIKLNGVEVEASPISLDFVGATVNVTSDDLGAVTVTLSSAAGGSSGQIQYNNAGVLGGFTVSGDGTINTSTGALAVTKTGGVSFGSFATGTDAANLTGTISVNRFNSGTGASSSTFLRGDGTWVTPTAGTGTVTTTGSPASGNLAKFSGATSIVNGDLSGDVTTSGTLAATIANDAVTYAKLQNVSATSRILGRKTASAGDAEECTLSEILDFIGSAAQGDVLYRGASSWARLGAGTAGQVLQTNGASANPSWVTPAGAVAGAGAVVFLSEVVTSGSQASVTFSSIAGTYRDLIVVVRGRGDASAETVTVLLQFNSDTASNYDAVFATMNTSAATGAVGGSPLSSVQAGYITGATGTANYSGSTRAEIINYRDTTFTKTVQTQTAIAGTSANSHQTEGIGMGHWRSTTAITAVKVLLSSGNFVDGSVVSLYARY